MPRMLVVIGRAQMHSEGHRLVLSLQVLLTPIAVSSHQQGLACQPHRAPTEHVLSRRSMLNSLAVDPSCRATSPPTKRGGPSLKAAAPCALAASTSTTCGTVVVSMCTHSLANTSTRPVGAAVGGGG
jgi:hypothetical protein